MAIGTMIKGAIAEPICDPIPTHDKDRPISLTGNHLDTTIKLLGYVPDSPIPNKKRISISENNPFTKPVRMVNSDHHKTIRTKTFLGPIRSPKTPDGISNNA